MRQKLNIEGIDSLNMSWDSDGKAPGEGSGDKEAKAKMKNVMVVT